MGIVLQGARHQGRPLWHWASRVVLVAISACLCWSLWGCNAVDVPRPYLLTAEFADPQSFNYYIANDNASREVLGLLYEGLTTLDPETLDWAPQQAESWAVSDDGLTVVFTMRPDLYWSDGTPLTAADVEFTFNDIIFNEEIPTSSRDVMRIGESGELPKVTLLDERHIQFQLPEPFAPFFQIAGTAILPKHVLAPTLDQTNQSGAPTFIRTWGIDTPVSQLVGNGPYVLDEYVPNQRITFNANPHYWKRDDSGKQLPKIPRIVQQIVASQDNLLVQFRSGSVDIFELRPTDFQLLKQEESRAGFTIYNLGPTLDNSFFCFNLSKGVNPESGRPIVSPIKSRWFTDVYFRRAVSHAVNRQALIDGALQGLGAEQLSNISPASPFHLSPNEGLPIYEYDPAKAKRLLMAHGYSYDNQGRLLDIAGNRVRFTLNTNAGNSVRESVGASIKSDLAAIGIAVDFVPIEFSTLVNKISATHNWDAVMLSFGGGGTEPNSGANIWTSNGQLHIWNPPSVEGRIVSDWEREIDRLFTRGTRELDFDTRKAIYDRFQVIVQEQLPLIGTVNPLTMVAMRNRLEGVDPRPILGHLWNLDELDLQP